MSKKMLKRSLALGALMAFVITGQAWAAKPEGADGKLLGTQWIELSNTGNISVDDLTIETTISDGVELLTNHMGIAGNGTVIVNKGLSIETVNNAINLLGGDLTVTAKEINIVAENTNKHVNGIVTAFTNKYYDDNGNTHSFGQDTTHGIDGHKLEVNGFDTLNITANGHGINTASAKGTQIVVDGNVNSNVTITSGENAVYLHSGGGVLTVDGKEMGNSIVIDAGNVTLNATSYSAETLERGDDYEPHKKGYAIIALAEKGNVEITATGTVDLNGVNGGIRAENGSTVNVTGNIVDIDVNAANDDRVVGVYSVGSTIDVTGTADIDVTNNGYSQGVRVENGGTIILDDIDINAMSKDSEVDGLKAITGKDSTSPSSNITVAGEANIVANGKTWAQGVYSAYSEVNFKESATIAANTTANNAQAYGVRVLSDTGKPKSIATFGNGANITVNGDIAWGILASGSNPYGVIFEKGDVTINATASGDYAIGVATGYNSSVIANADTNVKIVATATDGKAQAVNNTLTDDGNGAWLGNGKIELLGNVELIAKGKDADNSLAIYNEYYDGYGNGTTVVGSEGKKVVIDGNILTECGSVTVTFGKEGSRFDGKVTTEDKGATNDKYTKGTTTLNFAKGATWNLKGASTLTNATFDAGSTLVIEGKKYVYDSKDGAVNTYALNGVGDKATLTVKEGAKLKINGITETTYNIAKGFANLEGAVDKWEVSDINALMQGVAWTTKDGLQVTVTAKEAEDIAEDMGVSEVTGDFLSNLAKDAGDVQEGSVDENSAEGKLVGLANAAANSQNDKVIAKAAAQAAEAVQKMAEAGGNSATAANVVTNVTNVTGQRLSFSGGNAGGNKGGYGVGLLEEGSGAAIWAQYVHGKDSVEDMPSEAGASSYEGQYNGIVMGVDFKKVGKFQSGIAFNYGEGDTNSVNTTSPTRSEYDFWGIGYYGNIRNADSNVIFDIGYAKTDSDVTSNVVIGSGYNETFEASPETTTWTAGVKVEKLYQNNNVQIVPYTGLRYMSIDPDDYSTKCGALSYNLERQDIWILPVGVSIKQEIVNPNGWVVTPKVDLSYIWAFGDTDSSMETNTVFGSDNRPIGYDVMDDGSWMGLVGVEAAMDDWTFGVSYSYQKGDHSESKKWYVDAKYSF